MPFHSHYPITKFTPVFLEKEKSVFRDKLSSFSKRQIKFICTIIRL